MIVNVRPGLLKDADFEFFRTTIESGQRVLQRRISALGKYMCLLLK